MNRLKRFVAEIQYYFVNRWRHCLECKKWRKIVVEVDGVKYSLCDTHMVDYNPFHYIDIWDERLENFPSEDPIADMRKKLKESVTRGETRIEYE